MKTKLPKNSKGETLYPTCSWEKNQHKIYNAHDIIMNEIYDAEHDDTVTSEEYNKLLERQQEIEDALMAFDSHVSNGVVYATYKNHCVIKDIIGAYDWRH